MATTPKQVGFTDPALLNTTPTPSVAKTSPPTLGKNGAVTTPGGTVSRSIAPTVSGDTTTYNQAVQATGGTEVFIVSSNNNDTSDIVTVYNTDKQISVSAVNQTFNSYNLTNTNSYGNSNVAAFLPTYTGDLGAGSLTVAGTTNLGDLSNVYIGGGTNGQVLTTNGSGALTWSDVSSNGGGFGNITINGDNINSTNNIVNVIGNNYVQIQSNGNNWTFGNDGNLTLPSNTSNINYANGSPYGGGGSSSYGNSNVATFLASFGSNTITTTGNVSVGNVNTGGLVTATGNVRGGNLTTGGVLSVVGNANIGNIGTSGSLSVTGNANVGNIGTGGLITATGNLNAGNLITAGLVTSTGNITGGNLITGGSLSVAGNVTTGPIIGVNTTPNAWVGAYAVQMGSGSIWSFNGQTNLYLEQNIYYNGIVRKYVQNGAAAEYEMSAGIHTWYNAPVGAAGDILTPTTQMVLDANANLTVTGTVTGGNLTTGGTLSATGNITGGNLNTGGIVTSTGNITGGNLITAGLVTSTGNVTGGNLTTAGLVSATGNVSGGNLSTAGTITANGGSYGEVVTTQFASVFGSGSGPNPYSIMQVRSSDGVSGLGMQAYTGQGVLYGNTNIIFALGTIRDKDVPTSLVTKAYVDSTGFIANGIVSASGNITGGNLSTPGDLSVTGNITGGNIIGVLANGNSNVNIATSNGNVTITSNGTETWTFDTTGNLNTAGDIVGPASANFTIFSNGGAHDFTFAQDGTFYAPDDVVLGGNSIYIGPGANTLTLLSNAVMVASSNSNAYIQAVINNVSDNGSADWVATGHLGNDDGGWADIGFTSSGFGDANYTITGQGDGYVFTQSFYDGQAPGGRGGNLVLATGENGTVKDIIFGTGGFLTSNIFGRISDANNALELSRAGASISFPGNLIITGNTSVFGSNAALIQAAGNVPMIITTSDTGGAIATAWVEDVGNIGTSNIAAVYANPIPGSGIVRVAVGQNGGSGPNLWDFGIDGSLTVPGGGGLWTLGTGEQGFTANIADPLQVNLGLDYTASTATLAANNSVNIQTNEGASSWNFNSDGDLTVPGMIVAGGPTSSFSKLDLVTEGANTVYLTTTNNDTTALAMTETTAQLYANTTVSISSNVGGTSQGWEFNSNGSLSWPNGTTQTTAPVAESPFSIQSSSFNAVSGSRYGVDTTSSAVTATLPATPAIGDAIFFADAGGEYATNNLIINPNGGTIMGAPGNMTVSTNNQSVGLFFVGDSNWRIYNAG